MFCSSRVKLSIVICYEKNYFLKKSKYQNQNIKISNQDIKIFLKKKKKKSNNMVVNVTKISQKIKKINWLSIGKNIIE